MTARMPPIRPVLVLMHRWVGLVIAGFMMIAGATGALLAWNHELSTILSPELHHIAPPRPGAPPLDPTTLLTRAAAQMPGGTISYLPLDTSVGEAVFLHDDGAAESELAVDPYSGRVLARWKADDLPDARVAVMPFVYRLHRSLALGTVGTWTFGIVALLWTLDTVVGAYLTFPARRAIGTTSRSPMAWLGRWRRAWTIRRGGSAYRHNMDLHRAGGLWLWAVLFVFAWSAVGFNLNQVHTPVMHALLPFRQAAELPALPTPRPASGASWHAALDRGRSLMAAQLRAHGLSRRRESSLYHDAATGTFSYSVVSSADRADTPYGATTVRFDADTGRLRDFSSPLEGRAGDSVTRWMSALHMAAIWGRPYDVFVTLLGLAVVMLSGTGMIIWWKKRAARRRTAKRRRPA